MIQFLKSLLGNTSGGKKIFEGIGPAQPNFKILATHIRERKNPKNYLLEDAEKLSSLIDKWQFEPGEAIGRCGYDYQIVLTNGEVNIPISVCFLCNTLVFNHQENYKISQKQILRLLSEDFQLI